MIPALDEDPVIGITLDQVPREMFREIIVADNGSRDRTAEIAASKGARVVVEPARGYGAACLRALEALSPESEIVVFMDADASDNPQEAKDLLGPILDGRADFVVGSRTLGHAEAGALQPHQRFGNWLATSLVWLLYGFRYTDLGPFRAIRRGCLDALEMRDKGYGWTIEMQLKALRRGLRIIEVPVSYRKRTGVSKISGSLSASIAAGAKILWTVFRLAFSSRA